MSINKSAVMKIVPSTPELDWLAFELGVANFKYAKLRAAGKIKSLTISSATADAVEVKNPVWALS